MKKVSVVSIFENIAVCEDFFGKIINIELCKLPKKVKEGDILILSPKKVIIDKEYTKKRRKKIVQLQNEVFSNCNKKE